MKSENNSLQFTINPATVYVSANPAQSSYADITVAVENTGADAVQVNTIAITLPPALAPQSSLGSINPVAGDDVVWSFSPSLVNAGEFDAGAQAGDYVAIAPGHSYDFTLKMVTLVSTITQSSANVAVVVTLEDGQDEPPVLLNVKIKEAVAGISFYSQPANINPGEVATLNWQCENINYCIISPIDQSHRDASGSWPVSPNETTLYTLYAYGDGFILSAQWGVQVANPQIVKFGGTGGQSSVNNGDMLTLVWECNQFTKTISLVNNSGITIPPLNTGGNTPQQGTITVGPMVTRTRFTFTAYGDNTQNFDQRDPTIDINDLKATFTANPCSGIWEKDAVTLTWNIESASDVSITPALANGPSLQNLSGSVIIYPTDDLTYALAVKGLINNKHGHIEVPVELLNIKKVTVESFLTTPHAVTPDNGPNAATLSWNVNAQVVSIDNGVGTVNPAGTFPLTAPLNGTVFNLSAGTLQNPGMVTQALTIVNGYGPYTFVSLGTPGRIPELKVPEPGAMNNLLQGNGYSPTLTGLNDPFGEYRVLPVYVADHPEQSYFMVVSSPDPSMPVVLEWADPNNPTGTITLLTR